MNVTQSKTLMAILVVTLIGIAGVWAGLVPESAPGVVPEATPETAESALDWFPSRSSPNSTPAHGIPLPASVRVRRHR